MYGTKQEIPGSQVGRSTIQQAISALENVRLREQHLYLDDPDAQKPLRSDFRIQTAEKLAKENEPKRIQNAQALKAAGTSAGESPFFFFLPVVLCQTQTLLRRHVHRRPAHQGGKLVASATIHKLTS